ncbi:MAG TPA: DciA family protein [Mesorhizobium sp.]|jgi:hypothetical protein|nr:DciA family protein [Mesorhizobium sp.]
MAGDAPFRNPPSRNPRPLNDLASAVLDPVLRKRAGISVALIQSWEDIVGESVARRSRPEKIQWPRRRHDDEPFQSATLVVAAEASAALELQHQTGELMARVNAFLGFRAIGKVKLVQKFSPEPLAKTRPKPRQLAAEEEQRLGERLQPIEDEGLRQSLARLGRSVIGRKG